MKILFVHNNFPAQFAALAEALSRFRAVELAAIGCESAREMARVRLHRYRSPAAVARAHSFARRFDNESRRAEEVLYAANKLRQDGFTPDLVFVHPGWGEGLPLRTLFPSARIVVYCEYYYRREGGDVGFDPEFPSMGVDGFVALDARNAATLLSLVSCDAAVSPTEWQKSTYPSIVRSAITVAHDGVDTDFFRPDPFATIALPNGERLQAGEEIVTYASRNFEPLRGFHSFLRALPKVLEKRPKARALIVGDSGVSYGLPPRRHLNWKEALLGELGGRLDRSRVVFLGRQPREAYLGILQVSAAHVYLTYPFVLSWSMLEAMSAGCALIASDTEPVREFVDGDNGALTSFFDTDALADNIVATLADPTRRLARGAAARRTILRRLDAETICTPRRLRLVEELMNTRLEPDPTLAADAPR